MGDMVIHKRKYKLYDFSRMKRVDWALSNPWNSNFTRRIMAADFPDAPIPPFYMGGKPENASMRKMLDG